ncbi:glycoside hydrolase superfamily [Lipomyces starkeyi]
MTISKPAWWKDGTCYQIWPASYKDSNGDGLGDIPGIVSTLDYLKDLGIDIIWLSPMFDSPQADMGYDIRNYEDVYPPYGTLADMEVLIREVHARGMRLILDLVVNHTSNEHAWFKESKKSKDNDKADWYIWRAPRIVDGKRQPPNNWRSIFGGSAWEYVPERDEYYLHLFCVEQPDLNWENQTTRLAIYDSAIEFWLKKGIDGFRVDTVNLYSKDTEYPDAEVVDALSPYQQATKYYVNGPRMHEWLKEIRREVLAKYGDVMIVGELPDTKSRDEILRYVSAQEQELGMVFDFDIFMLGGWGSTQKHELYQHALTDMKKAIMKTQGLVIGTDAWTTVVAENHDQGRSISRFATDDPKYHDKAGKLLAILLATLTGTLFIYQGQEIGMVNVPTSWGVEEYQDVSSQNYWKEMNVMYPGNEEMLKKALWALQKISRDNARTPMQWDGSANAGFTEGKPWMRVHDNYPEINVEAQRHDRDSIFTFWKHILELRKTHSEVFIHGIFKVCEFENMKTFTFIKESTSGDQALVVLNFSDEEQDIYIPASLKDENLELLIGNSDNHGKRLSAWEGRVYMRK